MVGTWIGQHRLFGKKSLEGAIANGLISAGLSLLFVSLYLKLPQEKWVVFSLFGSVVSLVSELSPLGLDDNLTIPIVSATLLWLLGPYFGMG